MPKNKNIEKLYKWFLSKNGRKESTSVSLQSGIYLFNKLEELKPKFILDMGSGFSTLVIRTWQQENFNSLDPLCYTTDLDPAWLPVTKAEVEELGLNADNFYLQSDFGKLKDTEAKFDFMFVDLAGRKERMEKKDLIVSYLKPNGVMALDDWHRSNYRCVMGPYLESQGFTVIERWETLDRFSRFMVEAVK